MAGARALRGLNHASSLAVRSRSVVSAIWSHTHLRCSSRSLGGVPIRRMAHYHLGLDRSAPM
eukprot:COSAG02_NODE_5243_length_4508_cov_334.963484_1_plen_61_part_10